MNDNAVVMSVSDAVMVADAAMGYAEQHNVETFVPVLVMQHQCIELPAYRTESEARSRLASAVEFNGVVGFVAQTTTRIVPPQAVTPKRPESVQPGADSEELTAEIGRAHV